ncbi:MAG TPA: clostripain-related cysteine peptidase, partial [Stenomitos sp.]
MATRPLPLKRARLLMGGLVAMSLLSACGTSGALTSTDAGTAMRATADTPDVASDIAKYRIAETPEGVLVRQLPSPRREKMATILSYRAMDNDLSGSLQGHLNDLEAAGSSTYANLLALSDANGPDDSYVHYLCQDGSAKLVSPFMWAADPLGMSSKPQALKEVNTADPRTLERFVGWGFRDYPGRFKVLDVASHGAGYQGMCMDFTSNYEQMALPAFGQAVKSGLKGRKLDVLNLLACLMATVEVGYEFRDAAEVMVASEDLLMGGRVMVYSTSFGKLAARTDWERASAQD